MFRLGVGSAQGFKGPLRQTGVSFAARGKKKKKQSQTVSKNLTGVAGGAALLRGFSRFVEKAAPKPIP